MNEKRVSFEPKSAPNSKQESANQYFGKISSLASNADWDGLIDVAYAVQTENPALVDVIFVEAAKNNAPGYLFSTLSAMGASLPDNSVQYLIGSSNVETLEILTINYGLDLNYSNALVGNAFSHAASTNADVEVFDFLIRSGVSLDESGRFEPLRELIVKTVISGDNGGLTKIKKLIDYGAVLTDEHYEYGEKYRNYRPELYSLLNSHNKRKTELHVE